MKTKLLLAIVALATLLSGGSSWAATTFRFKLDKNCRTSAGVYKTDGTLLKALWKKKSLTAGMHSAQWDNTDESGAVQPAGNYQIKVIAHNVNYVWEGVIGNTSASFTGKTVYRGLLRPSGLAINGTNAFIASSYNEGQPLWRRFSTTNPQSVLAQGRVDFTREFNHVATDSTNVYYANSGNGWLSDWPSFVVANKVSDNSEVVFSAGASEPATVPPSQTWNSIIDRQTGEANAPTGIAVQYNAGGNILAVSHGGLNAVRLFNKTTGAYLSSISATNPGTIAFASNGDLWVICTNTGVRVARRYNNMSTTPAVATTISGFSDPLAIAVDPRTTSDVVAIADGGTSHQVKGYNSSGTSLWTLGQAGGYANGPTVTNDKFWFRRDNLDASTKGTATLLAFAGDGSFWLEDKGNRRMMHFSATRTYIDQISFFNASRMTTANPNNPTRVFSNLLEFQVDYSKPLAPGNGSWTLVKNWGWGHPQAGLGAYGFISVTTLSNGRTYALTGSPWENANAKLYELDGNTFRDTTLTINDILGDGTSLEPDGALQYQRQSGGVVTFYRKSLTGFNSSNNPQWGTETTLASAPMGTDDPYYKMYSHSARTKVTSSDVVISFDPSNSATDTTSWHLGGVQKNATTWKWKSAKTGWTDGLGSFQNKAIDGTMMNPGNFVNVLDRNVLYGFHGEFWKYKLAGDEGVGQANKFMHFYDNGLFVGELGQPGYYNMPTQDDDPIAGVSGNALTWSMVREPKSNEVYLYHCEESGHGGIHRWRMDGINNITEIVGTGPKDGTIVLNGQGTGLRGEYFDNADFTTLQTTRIDKTIDFNWGAGKATKEQINVDNYSVRWTGKVEAPVTGTYTFTTTTDDGARLWVNNTLLVDKWVPQGATAWSGTIALTAGQKYDIKMEYYESGGGASAQLSWAYPGQAQQIIPQDRLYAPDSTIFGTGTGLTGEYFSDNNFATKILTRNDNEVDFNWVYQNAVAGQGQDNYSVRWTGEIQAIESGSYKFDVIGDDAMKLWIGTTTGTPLIDKTSANPIRASATVNLTAGQKYQIKIEFREFGGYSSARLEWQRPGQLSQTVVPQSQLYPAQILDDLPDATVGTGLKGQYYSDKTLGTLANTRTDATVNFDWGIGGPMTSVGPDNFSVRWTGEVQAVEGGSYNFTTTTDDGVRLWVNNSLLVDKWVDQGQTPWTGTITLNAGQKYPIKMEYYENAGGAFADLRWLRPGQSTNTIIPQTNLFPAP